MDILFTNNNFKSIIVRIYFNAIRFNSFYFFYELVVWSIFIDSYCFFVICSYFLYKRVKYIPNVFVIPLRFELRVS